MTTKTQTSRKAGSKKDKAQTKGKPIGNQLAVALTAINLGDAIPEGNASKVARETLSNAKADHIAEVVPGLNLLKASDVAVTIPSLAKYPLSVNKNGYFTGRLMNINEFCRLQTGRAWSQGYAKRVLQDEGVTLAVLPDKTADDKGVRKQLSNTLDSFRPRFHSELKASMAVLMTRSDLTVSKMAMRQTSRGLTISSTALIPNMGNNETATLRAENAKLQRELEAVKKTMGERTFNRVVGPFEAAPIEIPGVEKTDLGELGKAPDRSAAAGLVENAPAVSIHQGK